MFLEVGASWRACTAFLDMRVRVDPESKRARAVNVLPPGPFSRTLLVIIRMSGNLGAEPGITALLLTSTCWCNSVMLPCTHLADSWLPALGVLVPWNEAVEAEPVVLGILPSVCHRHVLEPLAEVEGVLLWLADGAVILECWSLG